MENYTYSTTNWICKENPEYESKFKTIFFLPQGENRQGEGGLRTKGYFKKSYGDNPLISIIVLNGRIKQI